MLGVQGGRFKGDFFFTQQSQEYRVAVFSGSIIASESFDVESLCFDLGLVMTKLGCYFFCRFCDQEVYLSISSAIIYIDDVISGPSDAMLDRSTEI